VNYKSRNQKQRTQKEVRHHAVTSEFRNQQELKENKKNTLKE